MLVNKDEVTRNWTFMATNPECNADRSWNWHISQSIICAFRCHEMDPKSYHDKGVGDSPWRIWMWQGQMWQRQIDRCGNLRDQVIMGAIKSWISLQNEMCTFQSTHAPPVPNAHNVFSMLSGLSIFIYHIWSAPRHPNLNHSSLSTLHWGIIVHFHAAIL